MTTRTKRTFSVRDRMSRIDVNRSLRIATLDVAVGYSGDNGLIAARR
jgi:hypothetical protein